MIPLMAMIAVAKASIDSTDGNELGHYRLAVRALMQARPDLTASSAARLVNALMEAADHNNPSRHLAQSSGHGEPDYNNS